MEDRRPTMDQKQRLLSQVPFFSGLKARDLDAIAHASDEIDAKPGKVLAAQGSAGHEFYVIVEGTVSVERDGQHLRDLGAGDTFGELALVARIPRTATVTCTTPCRLIVLGSREFNALRLDHPEIESGMLRVVAQRLADLEADRAH